MKSSNRALVGLGIALGVLVIATVVLVLTLGRGSAPLLAQDTPEGAVQRFLLALQDGDYQKAYDST